MLLVEPNVTYTIPAPTNGTIYTAPWRAKWWWSCCFSTQVFNTTQTFISIILILVQVVKSIDLLPLHIMELIYQIIQT